MAPCVVTVIPALHAGSASSAIAAGETGVFGAKNDLDGTTQRCNANAKIVRNSAIHHRSPSCQRHLVARGAMKAGSSHSATPKRMHQVCLGVQMACVNASPSLSCKRAMRSRRTRHAPPTIEGPHSRHAREQTTRRE
jgi:hypothetical protein